MSFGSQTGRTRSGTKSFSSKEKKLKRKKQEFHSHRRVHDLETAKLDPGEVKARTIFALDRLGHQVISTEPGGYDLEAWVRSLNSLLDDFQDKIGADHVTDEFVAMRQEAVSRLLGRRVPAEVDAEIERLSREEEEAGRALEEARDRSNKRLADLKSEHEACEQKLRDERGRLSEIREAMQSRGMFSRFLRSAPSSAEAEAAVAKLESDLRRIEEETERSRKARSAADRGAADGDPALLDAQRRLHSARAKLIDAQSAKQEALQLARERETATQTISGLIQGMRLDGASTGSPGQAG